jgi:diazepam-binding inhibitor (GABA receptor modulating acyl-CoA-binding protein)|tara:strand:- start:79 stop:360 length:282 start_codon:yes stop_codon:yes gene_type:complete
MTDLINLNFEELEKLFLEKSVTIKQKESISNDDKSFLYKYYKQATVGDINIQEPSFFDFVGKQKYNAWKSVKGETKESCMICYINKVNELMNE